MSVFSRIFQKNPTPDPPTPAKAKSQRPDGPGKSSRPKSRPPETGGAPSGKRRSMRPIAPAIQIGHPVPAPAPIPERPNVVDAPTSSSVSHPTTSQGPSELHQPAAAPL